jgi:hypothetical protein
MAEKAARAVENSIVTEPSREQLAAHIRSLAGAATTTSTQEWQPNSIDSVFNAAYNPRPVAPPREEVRKECTCSKCQPVRVQPGREEPQ